LSLQSHFIFTDVLDCGLQIISAVLNSVGIGNVGAQNTGGTGNTPTDTVVSNLLDPPLIHL
jgi:hypothetical protein